MAKSNGITVSVEKIADMLEESGVAAKAFWAEAGVDPMPLPRASVEDLIAALADADTRHGCSVEGCGELTDNLYECDSCQASALAAERAIEAVADLGWQSTPRGQGQMVQVEYASDPHAGRYLRRTTDRSDGEVVLEELREEDCAECEGSGSSDPGVDEVGHCAECAGTGVVPYGTGLYEPQNGEIPSGEWTEIARRAGR